MTHPELIAAIVTASHQKRVDVEAVINALINQIDANARALERTPIHGFGVFYSVTRTNHSVRGPRTGVRYTLPDYISPQFWPSAVWTAHLNE